MNEETKRTERPWTPGKMWRPIETAPRDGTRICATSMGCKPHVYYWRGGEFNKWCIDYADGAGWPPTHWKPFEDGIDESLFEALAKAVEWYSYCVEFGIAGPLGSDLHTEVTGELAAAKAALAKALGGQP